MNYTFSLIVAIVFLLACHSQYTPKTRGYFKIEFPQKVYQIFDLPNYPYAFEYPKYATIVKDSSYFSESPSNPFWINIVFPSFDATIYISYIKIGSTSIYKIRKNGVYADSIGVNSLKDLLLKSYALAYKHTYKANNIQDSIFLTPQGKCTFFKVDGETATKYQFFISDSSKNYIRGVLYFNTAPNEDSLTIINDFIKKDMLHLIKTIRWK